MRTVIIIAALIIAAEASLAYQSYRRQTQRLAAIGYTPDSGPAENPAAPYPWSALPASARRASAARRPLLRDDKMVYVHDPRLPDWKLGQDGAQLNEADVRAENARLEAEEERAVAAADAMENAGRGGGDRR